MGDLCKEMAIQSTLGNHEPAYHSPSPIVRQFARVSVWQGPLGILAWRYLPFNQIREMKTSYLSPIRAERWASPCPVWQRHPRFRPGDTSRRHVGETINSLTILQRLIGRYSARLSVCQGHQRTWQGDTTQIDIVETGNSLAIFPD